MMKYWSFLLLAVMFCSGLVVTETSKAASKKDAAIIASLQELQQNAVGEVWVDYSKVINLIEQGVSRKDLRTAFNNLMLKEENGDALEKMSEMYFGLRLNPKLKLGGAYVNLSGYIYAYDQVSNRSRSAGTVYFWNKERTTLIYKISATRDTGYYIRLWYRQYDIRAYANKNSKYSAWRDNYWPPFPGPGRLDFHVY